ncbi:hypothetical protein Ddc_10180 [Ditylenchus destructor]|nr:hypothetical protein Ddc_10180 [Ditylenchus destructor]
MEKSMDIFLVFLVLVAQIACKPGGTPSMSWNVYQYGSRRIKMYDEPALDHAAATFTFAMSGQVMCIMNSSAVPKSIKLYRDVITYKGDGDAGTETENALPEFDNGTQAFLINVNMQEIKLECNQGACTCMPCDRMTFFLVLKGMDQCTLSGKYDKTSKNTLALVFEQQRVVHTHIKDLLIIMDMGVYDYSKGQNGTHLIPALAIGGKVVCSHRDKGSKSRDLLIRLRRGDRIINEAVTNNEGVFYMQIYDDRYGAHAIYDTRYDINIWIQHSCRDVLADDKGTDILTLPLKMKQIKGRKIYYYNYHTVLRAADFAVCPTFWFDSLELGSDLPPNEE